MDPMTILAATAIGSLGMQVKQSIDEKRAAKRAEESKRAQVQFDSERNPEQQTQVTTAVQQKDETVKGLPSQLLATSKRYSSPAEGDKTLLGQ